jgi:hypothetical protein
MRLTLFTHFVSFVGHNNNPILLYNSSNEIFSFQRRSSRLPLIKTVNLPLIEAYKSKFNHYFMVVVHKKKGDIEKMAKDSRQGCMKTGQQRKIDSENSDFKSDEKDNSSSSSSEDESDFATSSDSDDFEQEESCVGRKHVGPACSPAAIGSAKKKGKQKASPSSSLSASSSSSSSSTATTTSTPTQTKKRKAASPLPPPVHTATASSTSSSSRTTSSSEGAATSSAGGASGWKGPPVASEAAARRLAPVHDGAKPTVLRDTSVRQPPPPGE